MKKTPRRRNTALEFVAHQRNQAALVAILRNSAGAMKDKRKKRKDRKSWKQDWGL